MQKCCVAFNGIDKLKNKGPAMLQAQSKAAWDEPAKIFFPELALHELML